MPNTNTERLAEMLRAIADQEERDRRLWEKFREEERPCRPSFCAYDNDSGLPVSGPL